MQSTSDTELADAMLMTPHTATAVRHSVRAAAAAALVVVVVAAVVVAAGQM